MNIRCAIDNYIYDQADDKKIKTKQIKKEQKHLAKQAFLNRAPTKLPISKLYTNIIINAS